MYTATSGGSSENFYFEGLKTKTVKAEMGLCNNYSCKMGRVEPEGFAAANS